MSTPIILSDDDEEKSVSKKHRVNSPTLISPTILVLDDDPTPQKHPFPAAATSSSSFVPETPTSDLSIVQCTSSPSRCPRSWASNFESKISGSCGFVFLESESDESEGAFATDKRKKDEIMDNSNDQTEKIWWSETFNDTIDSLGDGNLPYISSDHSSQPLFWQDDINQVNDDPDKENCSVERINNNVKQKGSNVFSDKNCPANREMGKKLSKEERIRLLEGKKQKKEEEKLQKAALKAQAAELKKWEKEKQKWEKGKFASKSIVACLDIKLVEQGSIGGHLLTRLSEKGLSYRLTSNPIEKSIVWTMSVPEHISQLSPKGTEVQYVLIVFEAEEFCKLVINESLLDHVSRVQSCYPSYRVCYLTNRLMAYINRREKEQYKSPENANNWRCPPIEEVLAKLTTYFVRVHYRHCTDEAELAEHVVGLTCSLASCQFRNKLTRLSVNANGSLIPKDSVDKNLIKKSTWLKALVAIPKVQPRFAVAIWKKYPTMKSLLHVYMDPSKSVHEKEFLLENLITEGLTGGERRLGRICSKRIYRILMAQSGNIETDDIEEGADFFTHQQS